MARQGKYPLNVTENGKRGGGFGSGKQREGDNHDFWERSAQKDHLTILDGKKQFEENTRDADGNERSGVGAQ